MSICKSLKAFNFFKRLNVLWKGMGCIWIWIGWTDVRSFKFLRFCDYRWCDEGVGICWNKGVWDDDVEDDVGDARDDVVNGFDKWGRVAATNPKSSCSPLTDEPSSLVKLSANGFGGVSCWLWWCGGHTSWLVRSS